MIKNAIILIGGVGSRFSKINQSPKHLAKINGQHIIIRLINFLKKNGIREVILPLGYKKDFFYNFFNSRKNQKKFNFVINRDFNSKKKIFIKTFDAGFKSSKLIRIKKSLKYLSQDDFLVTYGDGLANVNLKKLFNQYNMQKQKKAFITSYFKKSQYGHLVISKKNFVTNFIEKPVFIKPINIGFFIFNKDIVNKFFNKNIKIKKKFLKKIIKKKLLKTFLHKGYFYSIDNKKDILVAEKFLKKNINE